ncbi:MAG: hypothetical protein ABW167_09430 [Baekduia sp.]
MAVAAAVLLCGTLSACGGGHAAPSASTFVSTPKASAPAGVTPSPHARRRARVACSALSTERALTTFAARARRSRVEATESVSRTLLAQVRAMSAAARRSSAAIPVAAALYATTRPASQRSGAFQGCLSALRQRNA